MKLELKHLAPYLPYRLQYKVGLTTIVEMTCDYTDSQNIGINQALENPVYKPILRPLIDLSTYSKNKGIIIIDGKEVCLLKELNDKYGMYLEMIHGIVKFEFKYDYQKSLDLVLDCQNELLKHHFDVFGLIDKVAIDINTLKI